MTVSTSTNVVVYRGNGAATSFAVPFKVIDTDHLEVQRRVFESGEIEYTYNGGDYSYSGVSADSGTLTLNSAALDDTYEVVIKRIVPYTQDLDIVNSGGFYAETVEEQLDLTLMGIQQLAEVSSRGLVVPEGEDGLILTKASDRAGKFLAFDANGDVVPTEGTGSDATFRIEVASNLLPLAGMKDAYGTTKAFETWVGDEFINVKNHYGITGENTASDHAKIVRAFAEAPIGATLVFPRPNSNWYMVTDQIDLSRQLSILMEPGAKLLGVFSDPTKYLLNVRIDEGVDGDFGDPGVDVRGMRFQNLQVEVAYGSDCAGAVNLEGQPGVDLALLKLIWDNGYCRIPDAATGYALRIAGHISQLHVIQGIDIVNGVHLDGCADATRFLYNTVYGVKPAFTVDLYPGSFRTLIAHNVLVSRDGAMKIEHGSQVDFLYNQIEQTDSYGANQSDSSASVAIEGALRNRRNNIIGNNFGGGVNVERSIYLAGDTADTLVDANTFGLTNSGIDIGIFEASVVGTRIGPNNNVRGTPRGGINMVDGATGQIAVNTENPADLLIVYDSGAATYGVRRSAVDTFDDDPSTTIAGIGLANGWTASVDFFFAKSLSDELYFRGTLTAGTVTAATAIGTFSAGFRPVVDTVLAVPTAAGATAYFLLKTTGVLETLNVPAAAVCHFSSVRVLVQGSPSYDPGI